MIVHTIRDYLLFMIDYQISFQGNFHMQRDETLLWTKLQWFNMFRNILLTIVDKRNFHRNCYIKNFEV